MLIPFTGRIGDCRWFRICAEAETTTETSKISNTISPRRCTMASDEEVFGQKATRSIHYSAKTPWSVTGVTDLCDAVTAGDSVNCADGVERPDVRTTVRSRDLAIAVSLLIEFGVGVRCRVRRRLQQEFGSTRTVCENVSGLLVASDLLQTLRSGSQEMRIFFVYYLGAAAQSDPLHASDFVEK